ncbi:MAG: hypothetical protein V4592_20160 [Bacteroidota bacterium]
MEEQYIEPEEKPEEESQDEAEPVDIYSRQAIFWFTVLFNPIFGGALLMQNLRDVGYKKAANTVIIFSILYFVIPQLILGRLQTNVIAYFLIILGCNVGAGFIFIDYFFPKYFPDNDYYPKSIWRVLFRCIILGLLLAMLSNYFAPLIAAKVK